MKRENYSKSSGCHFHSLSVELLEHCVLERAQTFPAVIARTWRYCLVAKFLSLSVDIARSSKKTPLNNICELTALIYSTETQIQNWIIIVMFCYWAPRCGKAWSVVYVLVRNGSWHVTNAIQSHARTAAFAKFAPRFVVHMGIVEQILRENSVWALSKFCSAFPFLPRCRSQKLMSAKRNSHCGLLASEVDLTCKLELSSFRHLNITHYNQRTLPNSRY